MNTYKLNHWNFFLTKKFILVEPEISESEKTVQLTPEATEIEISFAVPFAVLKQTFDVIANVKGCDESALNLVEWSCSDVDEVSEASLITCSFIVDTDYLMKLEQLPVVNVILSDVEGSKKHSLLAKFEAGMFI